MSAMMPASFREISSLRKYLLQYRHEYLKGFFFLFLSSLFTLFIPRMIKEAIDSLQGGIKPGFLLSLAGIIVFLALLQGVFKFWMRDILIGLSRHIEYLLRNDFFIHLERLPLAFFQERRTGDLISRATNDINSIRNLLGPGIMYFIQSVVLLSLDFVFMFTINWKLTWGVLIPFPFILLLVAYFSKKLHLHSKAVHEQFSVLNTKIQENFSGIRVIKAYGCEEEMKRQFKLVNDDYLEKNMKMVKVWGFFHPLTSLLAGLFLLIILWGGGQQVIKGSMSLGDLAAFISYVGLLLWPAVTMGWVITIFQHGVVSMGRLNEIFHIQPQICDSPSQAVVSTIKGKIEFDHLDFSYTPSQPKVLEDICLTINPGELIGLVGRTGSGKSTLANLIPRLYDASSGQIRIDGLPIQSIPLKSLRGNIGYVPQETFIFSDTIKQNINFGLGQEEDEQITEAAFFAHLLDEIEEFPQKFETMIGERGVTLSGGQKQRLALSRALIRKPPILILDDIFSNVDLQTERMIFQKIRALIKGRTCLLISQRFFSVKECDRIYVLDQGRINEYGHHQELLAKGGLYAELYSSQVLFQGLEEGLGV